MVVTRSDLKICIIIFTIGFAVMSSGCERRRTHYPDIMPNDFNFISNIADNSYILDTYKNRITKTIDWELDTTINYQLPLKEKKKIYRIIKKIDIYKYPENYAPISVVEISPSFSYQFKFTLSGIDYKISWKENTESETIDARKLRELFTEILNIIEKDEQIKNLPESKRAFL